MSMMKAQTFSATPTPAEAMSPSVLTMASTTRKESPTSRSCSAMGAPKRTIRVRMGCGTHMKTRDQKKITRNVADTCDCNGDQRRVGIAKAAHDTSQDVIGDDHQRTGAADRDIPARLFKGFFRRVHERCQLPGKQGYQKSQRKTCGKKQNDTGSNDFSAEFFVTLTEFLPEQNCCAHGERTDESCHRVHDL